MASELILILGIDWLLAFLQRNVHHTTVARALRIIAAMLSHPVLQQRFRDGNVSGSWIVGVLESGGQSPVAKTVSEMRPSSIPTLPGYQAMSYLLTAHVHCSHICIVLLTILLGRNIVEIPMAVQLDTDGLHRAFDIPKISPGKAVKRNPGLRVNADAALVLFVVFRSLLSEVCNAANDPRS